MGVSTLRAHNQTNAHTNTNTEWNGPYIASFPTHTTAGAEKGPVAVWEVLRCERELIEN